MARSTSLFPEESEVVFRLGYLEPDPRYFILPLATDLCKLIYFYYLF